MKRGIKELLKVKGIWVLTLFVLLVLFFSIGVFSTERLQCPEMPDEVTEKDYISENVIGKCNILSLDKSLLDDVSSVCKKDFDLDVSFGENVGECCFPNFANDNDQLYFEKSVNGKNKIKRISYDYREYDEEKNFKKHCASLVDLTKIPPEISNSYYINSGEIEMTLKGDSGFLSLPEIIGGECIKVKKIGGFNLAFGSNFLGGEYYVYSDSNFEFLPTGGIKTFDEIMFSRASATGTTPTITVFPTEGPVSINLGLPQASNENWVTYFLGNIYFNGKEKIEFSGLENSQGNLNSLGCSGTVDVGGVDKNALSFTINDEDCHAIMHPGDGSAQEIIGAQNKIIYYLSPTKGYSTVFDTIKGKLDYEAHSETQITFSHEQNGETITENIIKSGKDFSPCSEDPNIKAEQQQLATRANRLYIAQKYKNSLAVWKKIIILCPKSDFGKNAKQLVEELEDLIETLDLISEKISERAISSAGEIKDPCGNRNEQEKLMIKANQLYAMEKYEEAIKVWNEIVKLCPESGFGEQAKQNINEVDSLLKTLERIRSEK